MATQSPFADIAPTLAKVTDEVLFGDVGLVDRKHRRWDRPARL